MIVTLCGSCNFVEDMAKIKKVLEDQGHKVFAPEPLITEEEYSQEYSKEKLLEMKPIWTQNHFNKIKNSDAVLIVNNEKKGIKGYFGSNTLMELSVAFYLGKKIFLKNPFENNHPHYEEIIGLNSIILNNDLNEVK